MEDFSRYHFKEIKERETILMVAHRHWFDILQQFLLVFVLVGILAGGLFMGPSFFPELRINSDLMELFLFFENTLFIFAWLYVFIIFIDYYFDVWIITDERIVNIEQKGFFNRSVSELKFENIQDVTTEVTGLLQTVLNYGDVHIQTAAEVGRFIFRRVPNPYAIKDLIMTMEKRAEKKEAMEIGQIIRDRMHDGH